MLGAFLNAILASYSHLSNEGRLIPTLRNITISLNAYYACPSECSEIAREFTKKT